MAHGALVAASEEDVFPKALGSFALRDFPSNERWDEAPTQRLVWMQFTMRIQLSTGLEIDHLGIVRTMLVIYTMSRRFKSV